MSEISPRNPARTDLICNQHSINSVLAYYSNKSLHVDSVK